MLGLFCGKSTKIPRDLFDAFSPFPSQKPILPASRRVDTWEGDQVVEPAAKRMKLERRGDLPHPYWEPQGHVYLQEMAGPNFRHY